MFFDLKCSHDHPEPGSRQKEPDSQHCLNDIDICKQTNDDGNVEAEHFQVLLINNCNDRSVE